MANPRQKLRIMFNFININNYKNNKINSTKFELPKYNTCNLLIFWTKLC